MTLWCHWHPTYYTKHPLTWKNICSSNSCAVNDFLVCKGESALRKYPFTWIEVSTMKRESQYESGPSWRKGLWHAFHRLHSLWYMCPRPFLHPTWVERKHLANPNVFLRLMWSEDKVCRLSQHLNPTPRARKNLGRALVNGRTYRLRSRLKRSWVCEKVKQYKMQSKSLLDAPRRWQCEAYTPIHHFMLHSM